MASVNAVATPRGVVYQWTKGQNEYQLFPEEYFTGADIKIYFGDLWIDDILGLSFVLRENVRPLYSYKSRTYKEVARGNRIVTGQFYIAFKEAGYINAVMDHLGQMGIRNQESDLVSIMRGEGEQKWHAGCLQTMEQLMDKYYNDNGKTRLTNYEREIWGRNSSADINHEYKPYFFTSRTNEEFQKRLLKEGFDIIITYGPLQEALTSSAPQGQTINRSLQTLSFDTTVKAIRHVQLTGCAQELTKDNTVVELYTFTARDLD